MISSSLWLINEDEYVDFNDHAPTLNSRFVLKIYSVKKINISQKA